MIEIIKNPFGEEIRKLTLGKCAKFIKECIVKEASGQIKAGDDTVWKILERYQVYIDSSEEELKNKCDDIMDLGFQKLSPDDLEQAIKNILIRYHPLISSNTINSPTAERTGLLISE